MTDVIAKGDISNSKLVGQIINKDQLNSIMDAVENDATNLGIEGDVAINSLIKLRIEAQIPHNKDDLRRLVTSAIEQEVDSMANSPKSERMRYSPILNSVISVNHLGELLNETRAELDLQHRSNHLVKDVIAIYKEAKQGKMVDLYDPHKMQPYLQDLFSLSGFDPNLVTEVSHALNFICNDMKKQKTDISWCRKLVDYVISCVSRNHASATDIIEQAAEKQMAELIANEGKTRENDDRGKTFSERVKSKATEQSKDAGFF